MFLSISGAHSCGAQDSPNLRPIREPVGQKFPFWVSKLQTFKNSYACISLFTAASHMI